MPGTERPAPASLGPFPRDRVTQGDALALVARLPEASIDVVVTSPPYWGQRTSQGVGVEVGETEAAIDLDIVVEYGVSIADLGRSIQRNVKQAVERMTGLDVVEVNINVDDLYLPGSDDQDDAPSRVS